MRAIDRPILIYQNYNLWTPGNLVFRVSHLTAPWVTRLDLGSVENHTGRRFCVDQSCTKRQPIP